LLTDRPAETVAPIAIILPIRHRSDCPAPP
jgi:hypothetical protein